MMKASYVFIFILFLSVLTLQSQNEKGSFPNDFDSAETIFSQIYEEGENESNTYSKEGYREAQAIFLKLYMLDPENSNLAFKLGVCYLNSRRERVQAITYFLKAITSTTDNYKVNSHKERKAPLIAHKFLGDAYHLNYQFDKAIETYKGFIDLLAKKNNTDKVLIAEINRKIEMCKTGKSLVLHPENVQIQNIGTIANSDFADYSPVLSADQNTLFFTSRKPESTGDIRDNEGNYMEDIYICNKTQAGWSEAQNIGAPINTNGHEATVGISPDGQSILIYKEEEGDGNIYTTTLAGDTWSTPVKLNDNINSKYWEPSAFIAADGNTLYFTSNRPGGFGGRDLYSSKRMLNGDWGAAVNLGVNINTPYDEDAPFIHPDGVNLSFSSNGHNTMGGFDIFSSKLSNEGIWSTPINIGYPINTTDDDIFYVSSPDNRTAYFSSFREDGLGEKDNYSVTFLDREETPLTMIKGVVIDKSGKPAQKVDITVTDNETGNVTGIFHSNSKTGKFLFIITPGKNYNITYQALGHLFYSDNIIIPPKTNYYEMNITVSLNPIAVGSKIILNNIFFDNNKLVIRNSSKVELKNLVMFLKENPNLKLEISERVESRGNEIYHGKFAGERSRVLFSSLTENGVNPERLKLKENKIMSSHSQAKEKSRIYKIKQLNRMLELEITEIN